MKPGYKQTKAGQIPEDWSTASLGTVAHIKTGGRNNQDKVEDGAYPFFVRSAKVERIDTYSYDGEAILVPGEGGIGSIFHYINGRFEVHQRVYAIRDFAPSVSGKFVYFCIAGRFGSHAMQNSVKATVDSLRLPTFKNFLIPLPPNKAEQEAIAEALNDADALIESLGQLLTKKCQLKQGAMQELLTGKKRLPGFSGKWESKVLKKVIQIPVTDGPHLTPRFLNDGVPFLSVNNLVDNRIDLSSLRYVSREDHAAFSRKCRPQKGDVLLGKAASVGRVAIVDIDMEFNIWSPIALIRVNNENIPRFVYYSFQTEAVIRQIELLTNSSSQGNIGMGDIERLVLSLPEREEQQAIARILLDMDAEIAALETKLAKARDLKQGMMQELLTGRIRLV